MSYAYRSQSSTTPASPPSDISLPSASNLTHDSEHPAEAKIITQSHSYKLGHTQNLNLDNTAFDPSSSTVPPPTDLPPSPLTEPRIWFTYPLSYAANSIYRRVSAPPDPRLTGLLQTPGASRPQYPSPGSGQPSSMIFSRSRSRQRQTQQPLSQSAASLQLPVRKASPFQPPPLTPLQLVGFRTSTPEKDRILSKALAEEIRLLIPPRLQLEAAWRLCYSVEQDGASLGTLYNKCERVGEGRSSCGYVVVVRDAVGGIFGAFLTDPPRPSNSYYGTGECFLWSASIQTVETMLAHLPPPPSEDTTHMESRSTTILSPVKVGFDLDLLTGEPSTNDDIDLLSPHNGNVKKQNALASEEERIRFRAYPYSGVNDYMIYCEHSYMSIGGGDGKYGLWLDDRLEQGISSASLTFGNEGLSEEGEKFEALGVEVWFLGG